METVVLSILILLSNKLKFTLQAFSQGDRNLRTFSRILLKDFVDTDTTSCESVTYFWHKLR